MLAVREGKVSQVIGLSRGERGLTSVVVPVDVRVFRRRIEGRGLEGVDAAFAKARGIVDGTKGAIDGLELLLPTLQQTC